jgi:hypothetical protein
MNLREGGIYSLPNGRELVVLRKHEQGQRRYTLGGWGRFETSEYEVNDEGRLICHGRLTAWDITSLKDTGRSANELSPPHENTPSANEARA